MTRLLTLLVLCASVVLAVPLSDPNADPISSTTALSHPSQASTSTSPPNLQQQQQWLPLDSNNHPGHPMGMGMSFKSKPAVAGPGATQTQIVTMIVQGPTVTVTEQIIVATQAEFCIQATEAPHGPQGGKPPLPNPHPELLPSRPTEAERALEEAKRKKKKETAKVV